MGGTFAMEIFSAKELRYRALFTRAVVAVCSMDPATRERFIRYADECEAKATELDAGAPERSYDRLTDR